MSITLSYPIINPTLTLELPNQNIDYTISKEAPLNYGRAMDGTFYTYKKTTFKKIFTYTFNSLLQSKLTEIETFILTTAGSLIKLVDNDEDIYYCYFTSNPFDIGYEHHINTTCKDVGSITIQLIAESMLERDGTWDITTATYDSYLSVTTQETNPCGIFIGNNGKILYIIGQYADKVLAYSLNTAWDITTGSYAAIGNLTVDNYSGGIWFNPQGTKMYVAADAANTIREYSLSIAWNVSTLTYVNQFNLTTQTSSPKGLCFNETGTIMYVAGESEKKIFQYSLDAWDITTVSYTTYFDLSTQVTYPQGVFIDESKMYILDNGDDIIYEYDLGTAWNISTAIYNSKNKNINAQDNNMTDIFFKYSGKRLYTVGSQHDYVYQYDLE